VSRNFFSSYQKETPGKKVDRKESHAIRPIPLCKGFRDRSQWTYRINPGQKVSSCSYVWYIEGPKEKILVDAGVNAKLFRERGIPDEDVQSLEAGLKKVGLACGDIEIVLMTHLHWDHVALASSFPNAKFIVQKKEYDFAVAPHPAVAASYRKEAFINLNIHLAEGDQEITEGVKVYLTPGHTPGGQSVGVRTSKGLAVITGFCCSLENFYPPAEVRAKGVEIVAPGIHTDLLMAYDSVARVKEMADIIIPLNDPRFLEIERIP
jgi:glyoxylase-like metal-dependent hydrolase (beta-lactamase superfamily II)